MERLLGEIVDVAVEQGSVRDDYYGVGDGAYLGADYADFGDRALIALGLDVVSDLERLEQQYHESSGKVLHSAAQCHTDGHTSRSEQCGE